MSTRFYRVVNVVTKESKFFSSAPRARRMILEAQQKGVGDIFETEVIEYDYKYQLEVVLNNIFELGKDAGKAQTAGWEEISCQLAENASS